jgi:hypothetical protein
MKEKIILAILDPENPAPGLFVSPTTTGNNFQAILLYVLGLLMQFIGIIATIFLIIGAYYYITGAGNEKQIEKGKSIMFNAIIGMVVSVLSFAILKVIENALRGTI